VGIREIAVERMKILFSRAEAEFGEHPELSNRYVELARKISMKVNVPIPRELKRKFCKKCNHYMVPGKNCRVRIGSRVRYTCLDCGHIMRYEKPK
jgi:ribonuclease P protein subunit RPR2